MVPILLWAQPGNYIQQMLRAYEEQIGKIKFQQWQTNQKSHMNQKRLAFSEALLDQVSTYVKRGMV